MLINNEDRFTVSRLLLDISDTELIVSWLHSQAYNIDSANREPTSRLCIQTLLLLETLLIRTYNEYYEYFYARNVLIKSGIRLALEVFADNYSQK